MSLTYAHVSTRARRAAAVGATAALVGALAVAPAHADESVPVPVSTGDEYVDAIDDASNSETPTTIVLTADIEIDVDTPPIYTGEEDLVVDGAGYTVTSSGPGLNDEPEVAAGGFLTVGEVNFQDVEQSNFGVASVTIRNITVDGFEGQTPLQFFSSGALTVSDSQFLNNVAQITDGSEVLPGAGAISSYGSTHISGSEFTDNTGVAGGAVLILPYLATEVDAQSHSSVTSSTFAGNHGEEIGGALMILGETLVEDSLFEANTASDAAAIALEAWSIQDDPVMTISGNTFRNNQASGGSVVTSYGSASIVDSTFVGNEAADAGSPADSAIVNIIGSDAVPSLVANSTFTDNEAPEGALKIASDGQAAVEHSTFANNTGDDAAHLTLRGAEGATATISASAFTGANNGCSFLLNEDAITTANFDADGSCTNDWAGVGDIGDGLDAQLGALADNYGPTQTMLPLDGSPLIDAVPAGVTDLTTDQRGLDRPYGEAADIGAVEVQPIPEDGEPGDGGGEGPGEDGTDAGLVAFQVKTDAGTIYGTASLAVAVTDINWTSTANLTGVPADTAVPYGASGFTIEVPNPGDSVTVTLTAPTPFTSAYKVSDGEWAKIDGATFSNDGATVTYTLTDGGELDEDGEANGFIVDPVALAVEATFTG